MDQKVIQFQSTIKSVTKPAEDTNPLQVAYTNDAGSVQILFVLADATAEDLTGGTASILLQMMDGSIFQDEATVIGNAVAYTLTDAQGNHAGTAMAQIKLTIAGVTHVSAIRKFRIIPGIEDAIHEAELFLKDWQSIVNRMDAMETQNIDGGIF